MLTSVSHHIWYTDLYVGCLLCLAQLVMVLVTHPHRSERAEVTQGKREEREERSRININMSHMLVLTYHREGW